MRDDFNKDWPYGHQTVEGEAAEIVSTTRAGEKPIVALVGPKQQCVFYTAEGRFYSNGQHSEVDLVNAPAPKKTQTRWINVYADSGWTSYPTKEDAKASVQSSRTLVARKHVVVTEGEFDE